MDLSVIIVSYNVRDYLRECLLSVSRELSGFDSEVIVIDNNSSDGSCMMVGKEFPGTHLICNTSNYGFAKACNQGIRSSSGMYLLLLNPDTLLLPGCLRRCISFMNDHPGAGAVGARMEDLQGRFLPESKRALPTPVTSIFKISGLSRLFPSSSFFNRYYLPEISEDDTGEVEVLTGAFMFIRREALSSAGLLDESFFMYGEDIDISCRIREAGFRLWYYPHARIVHFKGMSTGRKGFADIRHFYGAMRIFARKHRKEYRFLYYLIIPAIYLRQLLALFSRAVKILFRF